MMLFLEFRDRQFRQNLPRFERFPRRVELRPDDRVADVDVDLRYITGQPGEKR